jgi:hypothetical protein
MVFVSAHTVLSGPSSQTSFAVQNLLEIDLIQVYEFEFILACYESQ